jgi:hypothetical protein
MLQRLAGGNSFAVDGDRFTPPAWYGLTSAEVGHAPEPPLGAYPIPFP